MHRTLLERNRTQGAMRWAATHHTPRKREMPRKRVQCRICGLSFPAGNSHFDRCADEDFDRQVAAWQMSEAERRCHRVYLQAVDMDREQQRKWAPLRDLETIFRKSVTPAGGPTRFASDYGHKAFPMLMRGAPRREEMKPSAFALSEPLYPIRSDRRLKFGFAAGDIVRHNSFGLGLILSIAPQETILQFDSGLRSVPTRNAHLNLSLLKKG